MIDTRSLDSVLKAMKVTSDYLFNVLLKRDQEQKLLVFYSLGFLADQYLRMSEDALKKGGEYQAAYFANKAEEIRQATKDIFGDLPEREYYKSLPYKTPKWYHGSMHPEQVIKLAQFCVANIQPDEEIMNDEKALYAVLREEFKEHRRAMHDASGLEYQYLTVLRERFKKLADKPPKLGGVYEMLLLLDVVDQIQEMLKAPPEESGEEVTEEEQEDEETEQRDEELPEEDPEG
ncbi:MAG: hypothetical protein QXO69_02300 [archaeon]